VVFLMGGARWRFWADQLLSGKSLATAGAAAVGLVGWVTTHNPAFGWMMLAGSGAWTALMYYVLGHADGDASLAPNRRDAVREVETALRKFAEPRGDGERFQWRQRANQLRRIAELERIIFTDLPKTTSGVSLLSGEQQLQVGEIVDQAVDFARRRLLLIRSRAANPRGQVEGELRSLIAQRQQARQRVSAELDELIALKREQAERIEKWEDDLRLSEINLDQIETFLRALAYDQTVTTTNVSERIGRVKQRVAARMESVQEMERRINEAVG
jgi:hypothetical protein